MQWVCISKKAKSRSKASMILFSGYVLNEQFLSDQAVWMLEYRKTLLISTYVFSGLATVQVLIFGGRTYFRGYDQAGWKIQQGRSLFNLVLSVENTLLCMFQRLCTYFQDTGYLYLGGMYFRGIAAGSKFQEKMKGTYFRRGTYLRGFTVP